MKNLLLIDSSGRVTRSITRRMTQRFADAFQTHNPQSQIVRRDVTANPPPVADEAWIAAAFGHGDGSSTVLQASDTLIEELIAADVIVIGVPIYNFGMPAPLKAYFDQIVRVGRTFDYVADSADPYRPLLADKPVIVVVSAGDGAMHPGGSFWPQNYLEPHLISVLGFIGLKDLTFVRIGYEEHKDVRFRESITAAEQMLDKLALRTHW